jgi:dTDP-3-amino-3,4,6-trideoxy-alpha-D-glucose transaminase
VHSRLDEIQAAVLRARLTRLPAWTERRRHLARRYRQSLAGLETVIVPPEADPGHVYHLFPVRSLAREAMQRHLRAAGVETLIHYPVPIPDQPALAAVEPAECPTARRVCSEIFSLPLYPAMADDAVDRVAASAAGGPARAASSHERA